MADARAVGCVAARRRIQDLLDGALPGAEREALDAHAAGCAACARALADARGLSALLSAWPRVAPSPGFEGRALAALRARRRSAPALSPRVPALIAVAAAAITALLAAPPTRRFCAGLLAAGADAGASDTITVARVLAVLVASLAPLVERASSLLRPAAAVAKAALAAAGHLGSSLLPAFLAFLGVVAVLVLLRALLFPRERRGFHALVL